MIIEEQYKLIAPKLTNWLVANGCGYAIACEIVQESFLRLWKMKDDLADDPAQVSGLVWTIARNLRLDILRKGRHEVLQEEIRDEDFQQVVLPHHSVSDAVYRCNRVRQALAALPPLLREAYTLFQIQELSIREIARRTNVTESLVKVRIFRAKEKLKPLLKDLL